jgi:hypothetical protein
VKGGRSRLGDFFCSSRACTSPNTFGYATTAHSPRGSIASSKYDSAPNTKPSFSQLGSVSIAFKLLLSKVSCGIDMENIGVLGRTNPKSIFVTRFSAGIDAGCISSKLRVGLVCDIIPERTSGSESLAATKHAESAEFDARESKELGSSVEDSMHGDVSISKFGGIALLGSEEEVLLAKGVVPGDFDITISEELVELRFCLFCGQAAGSHYFMSATAIQ